MKSLGLQASDEDLKGMISESSLLLKWKCCLLTKDIVLCPLQVKWTRTRMDTSILKSLLSFASKTLHSIYLLTKFVLIHGAPFLKYCWMFLLTQPLKCFNDFGNIANSCQYYRHQNKRRATIAHFISHWAANPCEKHFFNASKKTVNCRAATQEGNKNTAPQDVYECGIAL